MQIPSYPSIYNLGRAAIADLLKGPVLVEEKIDGSQFSFTKLASTGELVCRSKGALINMLAPEGMFIKAVEVVQGLADKLTPGWVYRGEYLKSSKHNVMAYERHPKDHIILFDITWGDESFCPREEKVDEALRLELEFVPLLFQGMLRDVTLLRELLETTSILGGQKIEGVVIKPQKYDLFGRDKKVLMGKFVSEAFREIHAGEWKTNHATKGPSDIIQVLAAQYGTPSRWAKALIHLKEQGRIENSPKDIGALIAEVPPDLEKECYQLISAQLMQWAWPQLRRAVTKGLPQWYKEELMKKQFEPSTSEAPFAEISRQVEHGAQVLPDGNIEEWNTTRTVREAVVA